MEIIATDLILCNSKNDEFVKEIIKLIKKHDVKSFEIEFNKKNSLKGIIIFNESVDK